MIMYLKPRIFIENNHRKILHNVLILKIPRIGLFKVKNHVKINKSVYVKNIF